MADETTRVRYPSKNSADSFGSLTKIKYPRDLNDTEDDFAWTKFRFFKYKPPLAIPRQSSEAGGQQFSSYNSSVDKQIYTGPLIALYSPEDIQAEYGVQWGGKSIQNFTRDTIASVSNPGASIGSFLQGLATGSTFQDAGAYTFSATAAAGLQFLSSIGQGEGIGLNDLLGGTAGVVLNPNTELLFQGFDLRNFNLQYKFVARNEPEAKDIQTILRCFKYAMLPGLSGTSSLGSISAVEETGEGNNRTNTVKQDSSVDISSQSKNFIQVPLLCDVQFMYGKSANPYITQFKPCAITGLTFNQTPDGLLSLYKNGEPTAITMNISFQETKLVYREEINLNPTGFTY